jgi:flagellar biosynthesis/type III secretory pathway M-ring protein FliF/YscJ
VSSLAILLVAFRIFVKVRRRKHIATVSHLDELNNPVELPQLYPASTALTTAEQLAARTDLISVEEDSQELAKRIRELAKREPALTANALRMWLLQNETTRSGAHHA